MKFGPVDLAEAEGALLGHSALIPGGRMPKGHRLTRADLSALKQAGMDRVIVARLEPGDLAEDEAASRLAGALDPDGLDFSPASTGRVNVFARVNGLFTADRVIVDAVNRIDPGITIACLADRVPVSAGDMVATIKIIPLAVPGGSVARATNLLGQSPPFALRPFRALDVALVATILPGLKPSVMDKTARVLERRLALSRSRVTVERRITHDVDLLAAAIHELAASHGLVVIFGASAVTDAQDVIPAAIRLAGGEVEHVGMPVDPGNLLVLGSVGDCAVIGAPGCARSPRENGFDWVLNRLLAGERPTAFDITGLGVGGLLMEIPSRPQPRAGDKPDAVQIAVTVLAAGRASRMGVDGAHKLLAEFDGQPLVRRSVETALKAGIGPLSVVTGHRAADIAAALDGLDVTRADNADFASGMASSLITGLNAAPPEADGLMVLLADMPGLTADHLRHLADAFRSGEGRAIVRAVSDGKRGNPVILPRATFAAIRALTGDVGARAIIETAGLPVVDVDIGPAAHLDVDTPEAVLAAGGQLKG